MPSTTQELRTEIDKIDGRIGLLRDLKAEKLKALRAAKAREDRQELLKLRLQNSLDYSDAAMATRGNKEAMEEPGPQLVHTPKVTPTSGGRGFDKAKDITPARKPVLDNEGEQAYDFDGNPLWQD